MLAACGCGGEPALHPSDAGPIEALAAYAPVYELDGRGRVVELRLEGKAVTDAALEHVAQLTELRTLSLYGSSVTSAGLTKLAGLERLEALGLGHVRLTRKGLWQVERIRGLRWLWLTAGGDLPGDALPALKQTRPGLTVYLQK
jgi:hypothetical protein